VGRGSYFNAHNFQTIGFQPTSYPKETCASQLDSLHTLEHDSTAIDLLFCDEVLGNRLVSSEWISLAGNPGDNLSDVVETITKEGLVPLHL
jgi:hypothetical protein